MQDLLALVKVQPNDLALIKHDLAKAASSQIDKAEVAVFKSAPIELSLAPITLHKMAALKRNVIKYALFEAFSSQIQRFEYLIFVGGIWIQHQRPLALLLIVLLNPAKYSVTCGHILYYI